MALLMNRPILNLKSSKKLPAKIRPYFLKSIAELLGEGFSIKQSLTFMEILLLKHQDAIAQINQELEKGNSFEQSIKGLGYSLSVISQLFYGQRQGRFIQSLLEVSQQLEEKYSYQQKLIKILVYPLLLSLFLLAMLFGMRTFILPHITSFISQEVYESQIFVRILVAFFTFLPQILGLVLAFILIVYGLVDFYLLKKEPLERFRILVHIPLLRKWVRSYCSYKIARELGHFFSGGYSLQQTLQVLVDYPIDPFLTNIAQVLHVSLKNGQALADILAEINIFTIELPIIIYQGELTSQTAQKCKLYSQKVYSDLMEDIQKTLALVQPLLFIMIAILVMAMYLIMMLPMLTMDGL